MPMLTREEIKSAALKLDPTQRGTLAEELLLSITPEEADAMDRACLAEAHRRNQAILEGKASTKPANEVIDRLLRKAKP